MHLPKKLWTRALFAFVILLVLAQFIPYGRAHDNPAVTGEPAWNSPRTEELAMRACGDCHSNKTAWPWYSHVAPISWLVQYDVDEGRAHFNFSEMDKGQSEADEAADEVAEGNMPPWQYTLAHGEARLGDGEKAALMAGLRATFGAEGHGRGDDD